VDRILELGIAEGEHPAIGVVDQHDLARAQEALRDHQRPDRVVGDHAARVADHVRVSFLES
jgi:hypothetical protein